jgi:hypothetical protein
MEQDELNSELASYSGNKNFLQIKQDEFRSIEGSEQARLKDLAEEQQQPEVVRGEKTEGC